VGHCRDPHLGVTSTDRLAADAKGLEQVQVRQRLDSEVDAIDRLAGVDKQDMGEPVLPPAALGREAGQGRPRRKEARSRYVTP
jgi:hypothetical protein